MRELAGRTEEEIEIEENSSLSDLIRKVAEKYGKEARQYLYHRGQKTEGDAVDPSIYFLINGANSRMLSGMRTKLEEGSIVAIIPPIGGG